jgi:hypothetical protein
MVAEGFPYRGAVADVDRDTSLWVLLPKPPDQRQQQVLGCGRNCSDLYRAPLGRVEAPRLAYSPVEQSEALAHSGGKR